MALLIIVRGCFISLKVVMSVFVYINVHILKGAEWTRPMGEKSYRHKKIGGQNICDDKVENHEKTCFKTAGVNGVLDIYWDIPQK